MTRVVITGGAGFIGSNLARQAVDRGHEVVVIDDLSTGYRHNLDGLDVLFVEASILDKDAVLAALRGADSLVHLAALGSVPRSIEMPLHTNEVNVTGTLTLLQAAVKAGVDHVVFTSSSSVYGANPALPKQEREWVRPLSPYAVSKLAGEQYVLAHQDSYGLKTLAVRLFNVYGPRQSRGHAYAAAIPRFIEAIHQRKPVTVYGDGAQSRDFTYVGTVCRALVDAVERRMSHPEPVNLAFGSSITINNIIDILARIVRREVPAIYDEPRRGDVRHSQACRNELDRLFPELSPTSIEEGIRMTFDWYASEIDGRELLGSEPSPNQAC